MSSVRITSEIGALRSVLVHTPGNELLAVTPGTREDYLYDDIIDLGFAHREHRNMVAVLERFAEVHEVRDLLGSVLEQKDAREFLIARTMDVVPSDAIARRLAELPAESLVTLLIEGAEEEAGPIGRALNEVGFALPPLPNLFFTRDAGMVVGEHVIVGSMRYDVRWSEEILVKTLFTYHPALSNAGILYDGSEERRLNYTVEGGDLHTLRPDLLVLGFSARSSPAGLDQLCEILFERGQVNDVIVVVMPSERTAIHLDMIFTQVDHEMCVIYPPRFVGPERLPVLHRRKGCHGVKEMPNFFDALKAVDFPLQPIFCGGDHRPIQDREQWASGCNLMTVRPGIAIAYARNEATHAEFEKAGYEVVDGAEYLSGEKVVQEDKRTIITVIGSELVRGGGGPHCMTLPVEREDVA